MILLWEFFPLMALRDSFTNGKREGSRSQPCTQRFDVETSPQTTLADTHGEAKLPTCFCTSLPGEEGPFSSPGVLLAPSWRPDSFLLEVHGSTLKSHRSFFRPEIPKGLPLTQNRNTFRVMPTLGSEAAQLDMWGLK